MYWIYPPPSNSHYQNEPSHAPIGQAARAYHPGRTLETNNESTVETIFPHVSATEKAYSTYYYGLATC